MKSLYESLLDIDDQVDNLNPIDIIFTSKTEKDFLDRLKMYKNTLEKIPGDIDHVEKGKYVLYDLLSDDVLYGAIISKVGSSRTMAIQFINASSINFHMVINSNLAKKLESFRLKDTDGYYLTKKDFDKFKKHITK